MQTRLTLHPEQRGAKKLAAQYGERRVCVRYRYDEQQKRRFKTVELIVDESPWAPTARPEARQSLTWVRVGGSEVALRNQIKQAGGRWDPQSRLWELPYSQVVALGLQERSVEVKKL